MPDKKVTLSWGLLHETGRSTARAVTMS